MKRINSLLCILIFAASTAFAQGIGNVTTEWVCTIATSKLPTGATRPPDTLDLVNPNRASFTIDLDAVTYDNATETTAFTAIGNAVQDAIDASWIIPVYGIDTSLTVTGRIEITDILRRFDNYEPGDLPNQYTAATDIFRVTGNFQWVKEPD